MRHFNINELVILKITNPEDDFLNNCVGRITAPFGCYTYGPNTLGVWLLDKSISYGKANAEPHELLSWGVEFDRICRVHGVSRQKDRNLLQEAYRRILLKNQNQPLADVWVGLGTPAQYRTAQGLFKTTDGSQFPRIQHWWTLTKAGIEIMEDILKALPIPSTPSGRVDLNDILYGCA